MAYSVSRAILLACFFFSGLSSLVYQTVWMRYLGHVFGNSVFATATVLSAFMGGLGLGSFLGGRLADRRTDRVRLYGLFEIGIGLYGLALPHILQLATPLYAVIYQQLGGGSPGLVLARALVCSVLLLLPTTLMGATLPLILRYCVRRFDYLGRLAGTVYAVNTFGAVAGCVVAGFVLMPHVGMKATVFCAVAVNLFIGVIALFVSCPTRGTEPIQTFNENPDRGKCHDESPKQVFPKVVARTALVAFALSGFAAMVDEVALTRTINLLIGSSTYAFSLMLTAFILGIGLGSLAFTRKLRNERRVPFWLGLVQLGIGLSSLLMLFLIGRMPAWLVGAMHQHRSSFASLQLVEFGYLVLVMLVPTSLMGAMFPLTVAVWTRTLDAVGRSSGEAYLSNTCGAILGSLAAGFLLLPLLGVEFTLRSALSVNFIAAGTVFLVVAHGSPGMRLARTAGTLAVGLAGLWLVPKWNMEVFTSGPYLYSVMDVRPGEDPMAALRREIQRQGKLAYLRDGAACTVTVRTNGPENVHMAVNGKLDASSRADRATQKLLGHIPMLLHPHPENALVIGLGSGMTLGAVLAHGPDKAECVEISPEVIDAAGRFFGPFNNHCLKNPRASILIGDGRNHVALTREKYDVIVSQPPNPWMAGVGNLFTLEFWQLCRARLRRDGIMCQWVQAYQMTPESFGLILRTFRRVFPAASVWYTETSDFILIGSAQQISPSRTDLRKRIARPEVKRDLEDIGSATPDNLLLHFLCTWNEARALWARGILHTDDNARLEFDMPRAMFQSQLPLFRALDRILSNPGSGHLVRDRKSKRPEIFEQTRRAEWAFNLGRLEDKAKEYDASLDTLRRAFHLCPQKRRYGEAFLRLLYHRAKQEYSSGNLLKARALLEELIQLYEKVMHLANVWNQPMRPASEREFHRTAFFMEAGTNLGALLLKLAAKNPQQKAKLYDEAIDAFRFALDWDSPSSKQVRMNLGLLLLQKRRFAEALKHFRILVRDKPGSALFHFQLALAQEGIGRVREALASLNNAVQADAAYWPAYLQLARIQAKQGQKQEALKNARKALELNPSSRPAAALVKKLAP